MIRKVSVFLVLAAVFALNISAQSDAQKFNSWQIVGPAGGDIRALVIDPGNKNRLFATTVDSQVYRSDDAGKTWKMAALFNKPLITLENVIVDAKDSNNIYVSGHRHREPGGFWYSRDGGDNWKEAKDLKGEAIHALTQSDLNPKMLVAGSFAKVFISMNGGEDWKSIENNQPFANLIVDSLAVDPRNTNVIYVGTSWRAYKTTDGGKTWKLIKDGMIDDSDVFAIEIDKKNPDHIISSACSGIYESFNGGMLWKKMQGIPSQSRRTRSLLINPANSSSVYAGTTEGFWVTTDAGKSWAVTTQREFEINAITVHPDEPDKIYIATNNYGMMVSEDGGKNFKSQNGNFTSRFMLNVVPDLEKSNRFYATSNNTGTGGGFVFISDNGGQSWSPSVKNLMVERVSPLAFLQDRANPNTIYIGTNIGVYRSLDRGASWAVVKGSVPATTKKPVAKKGKKPAPAPKPVAGIKKVGSITARVKELSYANDGKNGIFAATSQGLYRTQNVSAGWEKFFLGAGVDESVFTAAASPLMPTRIFAGTTRSGILVSNDNGLKWSKVSGIPELTPITAIKIDPNNADVIYVGTSNSFYLSRDGGTNWSRRNLPIGSFGSIIINPSDSNELFIASSAEGSGGIYQSLDAGKNWKRIDAKDLNLPTRRFWAMAFDPKNSNRILLGSHSSGIVTIERSAATASSGAIPEGRPRLAAPKQ